MKTIISNKNQTVFDLAVQHYGDADLFVKILEHNPDMVNDNNPDDKFDIAYPVKEGTTVAIDTLSVKSNVVRDLKGSQVVSFE